MHPKDKKGEFGVNNLFKSKNKSNKKAIISFLTALLSMIIAAFIFFYMNDAIISFIIVEITIIISLIKAYNTLEYKSF